MKKRVLIYFPSNSLSVDQISVMELLRKLGHEVFFLTWEPYGDLHKAVEGCGVKTFSTGLAKNNGIKGYISHVQLLVKFIKEHKIDIVFAHMQALGLIAGISKRFCTFKLYYFRHNTNAHLLDGNLNARVINQLTNRIVPKIIAVSRSVRDYLVQTEKVKAGKIIQVNLGFNFEHYEQYHNRERSVEIRKEYNAALLLICIGRFVPLKRHILMFETVKRLKDLGKDVKLICLGDGDLRKELEEYISGNDLGETIFLLGMKKNVLDYLEAADILLHFSESESFGIVVMEAGLVKRTVMVCDSVGVFNDFIHTGENGFRVSKENPVDEAIKILSGINGRVLQEMGENFHATILKEYDIHNVKASYERLLED